MNWKEKTKIKFEKTKFHNQTWSKGKECRPFLQLATQTNKACQ
jgi:hypothetical protein